MCTVSWVLRETTAGPAVDLYFNRDESRRRGRAFPPAKVDLPSATALMPTDTDAGGTWVATNHHGLTVALLNLYASTPTEAAVEPRRFEHLRSRGLLVRDLADAVDAAEVARRLDRLDPTLYRHFTLLVVEPVLDGGARLACWDGSTLGSLQPAAPPLVSSGHDLDGALANRRALWNDRVTAADGPPDHEACLAFHRSHHPIRGPLSPCMHRHDASTVSLVHVRVTGEQVSMRYADGPPCRAALGEPVHLDRVDQPSRAKPVAVAADAASADAVTTDGASADAVTTDGASADAA